MSVSFGRIGGMKTSQVRKRIEEYLESRKDEYAFLRSEFAPFSESRSGVDKALRAMVSDGQLVRVGYGVYVRSERRISSITGKEITARLTIPEIWIPQALQKLGVDPKPNSALKDYNEGRSTQVPAWFAYNVGTSRIRRLITVGKKAVVYERA